jgi:carbamoyl-phosphate synthase large subunit
MPLCRFLKEKNSMNILITSAGQRVSLVRAFKKELQLNFPGSKVFTVDMQPELSAACNVSDKYFKVRGVTDNQYITDLLTLCLANQIKMIVPTIDTELAELSYNNNLFEREKIKVIISDTGFIKKCRDKRLINQFFVSRGIDVPMEVNKKKPTFPLFIKPYNGSLSVDTFLIKSNDELTEYHLTDERFMFMEYLDRKENDEFTVDMYYGKDNLVKCIVPRKRIAVRAGEINKGLTSKNRIVAFLKEKLNSIEGAIGCLTVQVFLNRNTERIVGIEINPRFGGGYPLSYLAGANYPLWLIEEYFLNQTIHYREDWEDQLLMLRYDDEILVHDYQAETK